MKLAREEAYRLLNAKSIYIQAALPPEEATPPKWLTQRWSVTGPNEADLRIFISKQSHPDRVDRPFLSFSDALNEIDYWRPGLVFESIAWYKMVVTDRDGNWVMDAYGYNSLGEMWGCMYKEIQDRSRWATKQAKKLAKEKKKDEAMR